MLVTKAEIQAMWAPLLAAIAMESAGVIRDLAPLGAKAARYLTLEIPGQPPSRPRADVGNAISQDGKLLWQRGPARCPLIDLETGKLLRFERMRIGKIEGSSHPIVGTMSQWGHMSPRGELGDARIEDAKTADLWLGYGVEGRVWKNDRPYQRILALIDTAKRGSDPNIQADVRGILGKVIPARPDDEAVFANDGAVQLQDFVPGRGPVGRLVTWVWPSPLARVHETQSIPVPWDASCVPREYDPVSGCVLYPPITMEDHWREWDIKLHRWLVPKQLDRSDGPPRSFRWYWRGRLLAGAQRASESPGLNLYSSDRGTYRNLGPYIWAAQSTNGRFFLVKHAEEPGFWLVDCGAAG